MSQREELHHRGNFKMKEFYFRFLEQFQNVAWRGMFYGNDARPKAKIILWLASHRRLATKDKLLRFGLINEAKHEFCEYDETLQHMLFKCKCTNNTWETVLQWMNIKHQAGGWSQKLVWATKICMSKNWRRKILQVALAETIYVIWKQRNYRL